MLIAVQLCTMRSKFRLSPAACLAALLLAGLIAWAAPWDESPALPSALPPAVFTARTFTDARGGVLRYRLLYPANYTPTRRYPLVLSLHGSGSEGTDNARQLGTIVCIFLPDAARRAFPCFVLAPQCPPKTYWVSKRRSAGAGARTGRPSTPIRQTLELLPTLLHTLPIDARRLYVMGYSSGGTGVWDIIARRPQLFAAAVPMSGRGNPRQARRIAHLPLWAFQGGADRAVAPSYAHAMIAALRAAGSHPRYTEYPGADHNRAGALALQQPGLLPWLFAQRRADK